MKIKSYGIACVLLQISMLSSTDCGKVLVWHTEGSHWINMKIVLETLVDRGHEVTVLVHNASIYMDPTESSRFSYRLFNVSVFLQEMFSTFDEFIHFSMYEMDQTNYLEMHIKFYQLLSREMKLCIKICDGLLRSELLMKSLGEAGFEVLLADPIYPCGELVAEKLGIPLVYTIRFSIAHTVERLCGQLPAPPSYVPAMLSKFTDRMSFTDRLLNLLFYWTEDIFVTMLWREMDSYYTEILGRPTSFCEIMGKADIWLIRTYWDFDYPRPFLPNFKFVGGLHCKPAKPLPKDMEDFVQSSNDDGIIVFSLGTLIQNLTKEKGNLIATALGQIPQKVLWRYSGERPEKVAPNTRVYDWIPQNDLLGHPKTKAFITHGGTNGIYEAIYHGVPMVGIPMFADQPDNMVHMSSKGAAIVLNFNYMQSKDLVNSINTVINEPLYKESVMRLSRIHHDKIMSPLDEAVFWIEFVMRNKGAKHLRVHAHNLTWYQYHCLDVIATVLATAAVTLYLLLMLCCQLWRRCKQRAITKSKRE